MPSQYEPLNDAQWLRDQYVQRKRNTNDIAKVVGCSGETVGRALREHGIALRSKPQASRLAKSGNDYDELRAIALYRAGLSTKDIARRLGSSPNTICATLRRAGILRTKREAALRRRDTSARRMPPASRMIGVLDRCAACGRANALELHHVDADSTNNSPDNLIALCWEHHMLLELLVTKALLGLRQREIIGSL